MKIEQIIGAEAVGKMKAGRRVGDKAKAKARRRAERSAAVEANRWDDREGKARPTPERRAKGGFVLIDGSEMGVAVAVDRLATALDRLAHMGQITAEQAEAGHDFAALLYRTRLTAAPRDSIDNTPRGWDGDDDEAATHAQVRDWRERSQILAAIGRPAFSEMRRVCVDGHPPRRISVLREALSYCAKIWGY